MATGYSATFVAAFAGIVDFAAFVDQNSAGQTGDYLASVVVAGPVCPDLEEGFAEAGPSCFVASTAATWLQIIAHHFAARTASACLTAAVAAIALSASVAAAVVKLAETAAVEAAEIVVAGQIVVAAGGSGRIAATAAVAFSSA